MIRAIRSASSPSASASASAMARASASPGRGGTAASAVAWAPSGGGWSAAQVSSGGGGSPGHWRTKIARRRRPEADEKGGAGAVEPGGDGGDRGAGARGAAEPVANRAEVAVAGDGDGTAAHLAAVDLEAEAAAGVGDPDGVRPVERGSGGTEERRGLLDPGGTGEQRPGEPRPGRGAAGPAGAEEPAGVDPVVDAGGGGAAGGVLARLPGVDGGAAPPVRRGRGDTAEERQPGGAEDGDAGRGPAAGEVAGEEHPRAAAEEERRARGVRRHPGSPGPTPP